MIRKKELLQIIVENAYMAHRALIQDTERKYLEENLNKRLDVANARKTISKEEIQEAVNLGIKTAEDEDKRNKAKAEETAKEIKKQEQVVQSVLEENLKANWHDRNLRNKYSDGNDRLYELVRKFNKLTGCRAQICDCDENGNYKVIGMP